MNMIPGFNAHASLNEPAGAVTGVPGSGSLEAGLETMALQRECCRSYFNRCLAYPPCRQYWINQSNYYRAIVAHWYTLGICNWVGWAYADPCHSYLTCNGNPVARIPNWYARSDWSCVCNTAC
jgi:hypothetical protein